MRKILVADYIKARYVSHFCLHNQVKANRLFLCSIQRWYLYNVTSSEDCIKQLDLLYYYARTGQDNT